MKKYSNIPLKERKRNADRVYRHELRLERINEKRLEREKERENQEYIEEKKKAFMQYAEGSQSDKEQQWNEAYARLKAFEKSEDTE